MNPLLRIPLLAGLLLAPACAPASYARSSRPRPIEIEVANHNWMDMVIHAQRDGTRVRLGLVRTENRARFVLPRHLAYWSGGVIPVADRVGSADVFTSDAMLVEPGARIVWSLENQISLSAHRIE